MTDRQIQEKIIMTIIKEFTLSCEDLSEKIGEDLLITEAHAQDLGSKGFVDVTQNIYGELSCRENKRTKSFLVLREPVQQESIIIHGNNNQVAGRDIIYQNSDISNAVRDADIPDELKGQLETILLELKDTRLSHEEKNKKASGFIAKAGEFFGAAAAGVVSSLIIRAITGGF